MLSNKTSFYLRPLPTVPVNPSLPWYAKAPVGRDSLNKVVKKMCQEAKIEGNKTNHSLRARGTTQLYERGVPEKQIQERTGHRSLDALHVYERTSEAQHRAVTSVLCSTLYRLLKEQDFTRSAKYHHQESPLANFMAAPLTSTLHLTVKPLPLSRLKEQSWNSTVLFQAA